MMQQNILNNQCFVDKHICRSHQLTLNQNLQKSLPTRPHRPKDKNGQLVTACIVQLADILSFKGSASNKLCSDLTVLCFESPTDTIHAKRCASAKKKTPTMEILPDKKELIMKGGTFQEQLSAFQ